MRILILSQYFWPESFRITEVARTLKDAGNEIFVLTGQPNYPDGVIFDGYSSFGISSETHDQLKIYRVPLIPRGQGNAFRLILNYLSFVITASTLGPWLLRGKKIDCILVYAPSPILQSIPAILIGKIKSAQVAIWVQDLWPESLSATGFINNKLLLSLVTKIVSWIYRQCDLLLAQSHAFVEPIKKLAGNTPIVFHPNPGELAFSNNSTSKPQLILESGFNIVFAGNLGTVQALGTVLDAADQLRQERNIRFIIIGSGSCLEWLMSEIVRLHLDNVILPGRFPAESMPAILEQASVLLVSLIRSPIMSLTVPSKIQAYLAARKPIIASMDGEGARIVEEAGAGIACPAEDSHSLVQAILKLRDMTTEELSQMGERAGRYYQDHFEPRMLANRLEVILSNTTKG